MDLDRIEKQFTAQGLSASRGPLASRIMGWVDTKHPAMNAVFGPVDKGVPLGRLIGITGAESHGKSALLYWLGGVVQAHGGVVFLADEEGAFQEDWALKFGLDKDGQFLPITLGFKEIKKRSKPNEILPEALEDLLRKFETAALTMREHFPDTPAFILWDSVAATLTQKELEGEYGDQTIAQGARILSAGMRKLHKILIGSRVSLIYVNQYRTKIPIGYGVAGNTMPGGRALSYYSSILAEVYRTKKMDGYVTCIVRNKKNKVSVPFRTCNFKIHFEEGLTDVK